MRRLLLLLATLLGGFLGFLLVWIREGLSGRIVDASDLEPAGVRAKATWPAALDLPGAKTQFLPEVPKGDVAEVRALAATMWPTLSKTSGRDVTLLAPLTGQSIAPLTLAIWLARELDGMGHRVAVVNADSASASSRSALSAITAGSPASGGVTTGHLSTITGYTNNRYAPLEEDELRGYASTLPVLANPEVLLYSVKSVRPRTPVPDAATSTMVNRSGEAAGTPTAVR